MPERFSAAYWRERAEEARMMADGMRDPNAKRTMLEIAVGYESLAERTEKLDREKAASQTSN